MAQVAGRWADGAGGAGGALAQVQLGQLARVAQVVQLARGNGGAGAGGARGAGKKTGSVWPHLPTALITTVVDNTRPYTLNPKPG